MDHKPVFILSTGFEVEIVKDSNEFITNLANAIIKEVITKYGQHRSFNSWDPILKLIEEEVDYVITRNIPLQGEGSKPAEILMKGLLGYIIAERFNDKRIPKPEK